MKLLPTFGADSQHSQLTPITASLAGFILIMAVHIWTGSIIPIFTVWFADYALSFLQLILNYYPEDSDPEFMLMWVITSALWIAALEILFLRATGFLKTKWLIILSSFYIIAVIGSIVISHIELLNMS